MADIFLSYTREDQATAQRFAEGFEAQDLSVWWDATLRSGEAYDTVTEEALRTAKAVVVLWSKRSVLSRWVRAEATLAHRNRTLVPAMIEPCERPIMFELTQTADLSHWSGATSDPAWRAFLVDVRRFVEAGAAPACPDAPAAEGGLEYRRPDGPTLEPRILQEAERRLTSFMGPIAPRLVACAARAATTRAELYARLAESIPNPAERRSFLDGLDGPAPGGPRVQAPRGEAPATPPDGEISPDDLQLVVTALIRQLGPIAGRLVAREQACAISRLDLCERLGRRIMCETDRAAFLKEVGAAIR
jgi:hypothetical protein